MGVLYLFIVVSVVFVIVCYCYMVIVVCVQVFIQINLLLLGSKGVIGEWLVDMLIGVVIVIVFSYVLFVWEYCNFFKLVDDVFCINCCFIEVVCELLFGMFKDDFVYCVQCKQYMELFIGLILVFVWMLDELKSCYCVVDNFNCFIVQNYLVVVYVVVVCILMCQCVQELDEVDICVLVEQIVEVVFESFVCVKECFDQVVYEGGWGVCLCDM